MVTKAWRGTAQGLSAALALLAFAPPHAHAWTEAQVNHVAARIDASNAQSARVELDVGVHVTGGWLSSFEIVGLDSDMVLAADKPIELVTDTGATFSPEASLPEPGTLVLKFASRAVAPRRGEHVIHIAYDTHALFAQARRVDSGGHTTLHARWALPRWDVSLSDVHVDVTAPAGTRVAPESSARSMLDGVTTQNTAGATLLGFSRTTLPRTQSFEVVFDVPVPLAADAAISGEQSTSVTRMQAWLVLSLLLGMLALFKRALTRRSAKHDNLDVDSMLTLPVLRHELARSLLVLGACAASGVLAMTAPLAATLLEILGVALALDRGFTRKALPVDAVSRTAVASDFEIARRTRRSELLGTAAWLDATTPAGLFVLCSLYALAYGFAGHGQLSIPAISTALLATPLFLTATRLQRPITAHRVLHHLATLQTSLRDVSARATLVVYTSAAGRVLETRIRFALTSVPAGMGKLELIVTDGAFYGAPRWALSWLAQCHAHSTADSLLQRALPNAIREQCSHEGHIAYVAMTADVAQDAAQLLPWLKREVLTHAA